MTKEDVIVESVITDKINEIEYYRQLSCEEERSEGMSWEQFISSGKYEHQFI